MNLLNQRLVAVCQQALQSLLAEALELENDDLMGVIPYLLQSRTWDA